MNSNDKLGHKLGRELIDLIDVEGQTDLEFEVAKVRAAYAPVRSFWEIHLHVYHQTARNLWSFLTQQTGNLPP